MAGTYEVKLKIKADLSVEDDELLLFEVVGEAGERTVYKEMITKDDFDIYGQCEKSMIYEIWSIPKVSYAISVITGIHVEIEEISWRRLS